MAQEHAGLRERVTELERRVRVLERRLVLRALATETPVESPIEAPVQAVVEHVEPFHVSQEVAALGTPPVDEPMAAAPAPPPVIPIPALKRIPAPPRAAFDLERLIGMRLFAAIGAIVVVIGVGLFLKLAYDRGWLNLVPPVTKCISGAVFGAVLLAAGEWLRRKWGAIASVGVSAAGLGVLFASVFAAHGVYHLMHPVTAFVLLAGVAAVGFAVAARGRLASIAVLALVAAYVNPIIIGEPSPNPWTLPVYLFVILCTGLALSAWRAVPFRVLRGLVWWGTLLFGTGWILGAGLDAPTPALALLAAVWIAVHLELASSARRPRSVVRPSRLEIPWPSVRFVATSFTTSAWAACLAVVVLRRATQIPDWWAPALGAAGAVGLAVRLAGNLRVLRDVPRNDSERLGAGLAMQAGALLIAAVALALSGWMETVAWLGLGVAAVGAGRWIRSRGLEVYGLVPLVISAVRLVAVDSPAAAAQPWMRDLGGIVLTPWSILMLAGAAAWGCVFALLRPGPAKEAGIDARPREVVWSWGDLGLAALVIALCHLNGAVLHTDSDAGSVCLIWLVLGLVGLVIGRGLRATPLLVYGVIVLGLATIRFVVGAPLGHNAPRVIAEAAGLVVSRWTILMLAAAAAWFLGAALIRESSPAAPGEPQWRFKPVLVGVGITVLFASILHPKAEAESIALAWLGLGTLAVMLHSVWKRAALDLYGLAGLLAAVAAWGVAYCPTWMTLRSPVFTHAGLWSSGLIAATALGLWWWLGSERNPARPTSPDALRAVVPGVVVLLFTSTSLEVARAAGVLASDPTVRRAAVSIWWGLVAVGLIIAGFVGRRALSRHAGLALMSVATAKAFFFDLAEVPQAWRIASFVGLGLLMLGIAVGYARAAALFRGGSLPSATRNPT